MRLTRQNSAAIKAEERLSAPATGPDSGAAVPVEIAVLSQSDPTDHALAAIASILDGPEPDREPERAIHRETPDAPGRIEADGYSKVGPGPMQAIRFKWTVRRESDGQYFVDETIGENSQPVSSGPMSAEAATRLVDEREREAQQRFETLKSEMAGRAAANMVGRDQI